MARILRDPDIEAYRALHDRTAHSEPEAKGFLRAELRLFAPAIAGEALSGKLGIIASLPGISHLSQGSAARKSLAKESVTVTAGRKATEDYADYLQMACFRAHILWADDDSVVACEAYQRDIWCTNLPPGTDHQTICKPNWRYVIPINFVENGVVNGKC